MIIMKKEKDVEYQKKSNNAIEQHVQETSHETNWKEAECLECEKEDIKKPLY